MNYRGDLAFNYYLISYYATRVALCKITGQLLDCKAFSPMTLFHGYK